MTRHAKALFDLVGRLSMLPNRAGRIINVASIAGLGGNPAFMKTIACNTSKGTKALASEWGPHGITVNAIAPGPCRTRMAEGKHITGQVLAVDGGTSSVVPA